MPTQGSGYIAEMEETDSLGTAGAAAPLEVDEYGNLRVVPGGAAAESLDSRTTANVQDRAAQRQVDDTNLLLRAILNHMRALNDGKLVVESEPL